MAVDDSMSLPQTPPATANGRDGAKPEVDKPVHELLSHSLVDLYVGPDSTQFPIHEKLVCHHSPVLRKHFYARDTRNKSYGLPDDEVRTFQALLAYMYSGTLAPPTHERDMGPLLDLYLLAVRLEMARLQSDIVDAARTFYHQSSGYPSLRRVQYVYDNTSEDNAMREMMVGAVARFLTLGQNIPKHWDSALRRNGQLAVDIIRAIQEWHLESRSIPDVRDGRWSGFSGVVDTSASEPDFPDSPLNNGVKSISS